MMFIQTREYRFADSLELFWVDIPENDHLTPVFGPKWVFIGTGIGKYLFFNKGYISSSI